MISDAQMYYVETPSEVRVFCMDFKNGLVMNDNNKSNWKETGRRPKEDPATIRYTISFNEQEHARFSCRFYDKSR